MGVPRFLRNRGLGRTANSGSRARKLAVLTAAPTPSRPHEDGSGERGFCGGGVVEERAVNRPRGECASNWHRAAHRSDAGSTTDKPIAADLQRIDIDGLAFNFGAHETGSSILAAALCRWEVSSSTWQTSPARTVAIQASLSPTPSETKGVLPRDPNLVRRPSPPPVLLEEERPAHLRNEFAPSEQTNRRRENRRPTP